MRSDPDSTPALRRGLSGYLRAVAKAVGVPAEGTSFEISDTATAYLALNRRLAARPGQDLMLEWSERTGWVLAVETDPGQTAAVIGYLGGADVVPTPAAVADFVVGAIENTIRPADQPAFGGGDRHAIAERLAAYGI